MKTIKEALNRLKWSFSDGFKHQKNKNDIEALNLILRLINSQNQNVVQENLLFAKMYAYTLNNFLTRYDDVDFASKMINKDILSVPMSNHCEKLKMTLRHKDIGDYFKNLNLKPVWEDGQTIDEIKKNIVENNKVFKNEDVSEFISVIDFWDSDSVVGNLNMNINLAINTYKNNV